MGKKELRFSDIEPREQVEFYCEVADSKVKISKWYRNFGDRRRIDDPEAYVLVCLDPYREAGGKQFGCGNERFCPMLERERMFEKNGKYPEDDAGLIEELKKPQEKDRPSETVSVTTVGGPPARKSLTTVEREKLVLDNARQYMIFISNYYKGSDNKVVGLSSIKAFFHGDDQLLGRKVVRKICSLGLGELFIASNNNPSFNLYLSKMRKYIEENPEEE